MQAKPTPKPPATNPVASFSDPQKSFSYTQNDPFEDLLHSTPKDHFVNPEKKNDPNTIDFLLDLTMGESKITQNPTPVVIKKHKEIRNEVSSDLRRANIAKSSEKVQEDSGNLFAGISTNKNFGRQGPVAGKVNEGVKGDGNFQGVNVIKLDIKNEKEKKESKEKNEHKEKNKKVKNLDREGLVKTPEVFKESLESIREDPEIIKVELQRNVFEQLKLEEENIKNHQEELKKHQEELEAQEKVKEAQRLLEQQQETERVLELQRKKDQESDPNYLFSTKTEEISLLKQTISKIISDQSTLSDVQENYQNDLKQMEIQQKDLENLACEAANNEDFELAVKYSDERDNLLLKIEFTKRDFEAKAEEYLQFEFKKSEIFEEILGIYNGLDETLEKLRENCEADIQGVKLKAEKTSESLEEVKKRSEREIESKKEEILLIEEAFKGKKEEVQGKLKEKIDPVEESKKETEGMLEGVEKEIEELERLIKEKMRVKDDLIEQLKTLSSELESIPSTFSEDFKDLESAEFLLASEAQFLESLISQASLQSSSLSQDLDSSNTLFSTLSQNQLSLNSIQSQVKSDLFSILQTINSRKTAVQSIQSCKSSLSSLQSSLSQSESSLLACTSSLNTLKQDLQLLESRSEEIKTKLPQLDQDKKSSTNNKQFKEAARLNTEIKDLSQELQENLKKTSNLQANLESLTQQSSQLQAKILKKKEKISKLQEKVLQSKSELLILT